MGTPGSNCQWLKSGLLAVILLGLCPLSSCKHRRGPSVPEEWDPSGRDASVPDLKTLLSQTKILRILELFDDGFIITDSLTYRVDPQQSALQVERRFDPVPSTSEEPLVIQSSAAWSIASQQSLWKRLENATVRQVPRCNPYGTLDGGYGGRFLILVNRSGQEHRLGVSDAACAATDHDCSGSCLSSTTMDQVLADLNAALPIPEKPVTVFSCAPDSPLPCGQKEAVIFGAWQGLPLRADIRRALAARLCELAAFTLEPANVQDWVVRNSSRETIGTVRIDSENRTVACVTR